MKKNLKTLKRIGMILLGLFALFVFANLIVDEPVIGEIQEHPLPSGSVWGEVEVNKDAMTDEMLVEFYNDHIADYEGAWFILDFGDGTGYHFFEGSF